MRRQRRDARRAARRRRSTSTHSSASSKHGARAGDARRPRRRANDAPSNTTSSWPPTRCAYSSGRPHVARALGHARLALAALAEVERRRVEHAQHLGARRLARSRAGSSNQASSQISTPTRTPSTSNTHGAQPASRPDRSSAARRTPGSWAARACSRSPAPGRRRAREAALKRRCTATDFACAAPRRRTGADGRPPRAARCSRPARAASVCQRLGAGAHEGRAQQQVFGRIAAQRELGREHQARALLRRPRARHR